LGIWGKIKIVCTQSPLLEICSWLSENDNFPGTWFLQHFEPMTLLVTAAIIVEHALHFDAKDEMAQHHPSVLTVLPQLYDVVVVVVVDVETCQCLR